MKEVISDVPLTPYGVLGIFDVERTVVEMDQTVLYYLDRGPKRLFVREELEVVPEDTELPPEHVLKS